MKRFIDKDLDTWAKEENRKPLLVRGARQVGKTYAVRQLGKKYENFIEINFELFPEYKNLFQQNLDPKRIIKELSYKLAKEIIPKETLLFFDEIQAEPKALLSLRYFFEEIPDLPVIAAGSLLDFAIEEVGIPVGRVMSLYVYPCTFLEFLSALDKAILIDAILDHDIKEPINESLHTQLLELFGEYLAIGGMPEAIVSWKRKREPLACSVIQHSIIDSYRQDFNKYAKNFQIKYVSALFDSIPRLLGKKFMYTAVEGDYRARELIPGLDLLETAGIIRRIYHTAAHHVPLGSEANFKHFKVLFLDCALAQALLGLSMNEWLHNPLQNLSNKGPLVEAAIGQELLGYSYPHIRQQIYYWQRQEKSSQAEVDYVLHQDSIIPIEVKGGQSSRLLSLHSFIESHPNSPYGVRFSVKNYGNHDVIRSYPIYAVAAAFKSYAKRARNLRS